MSPRFAPGDRVAVGRLDSPGHIRTPYYVRGHIGEVERFCGLFANAEELAYGRPGLPARPLYRVRFPLLQIWTDYDGTPADCVEIELLEHWLEPAESGPLP
jgi:nitrile hydratase